MTDTLATEPQTPQAPPEVRDIREVVKPDSEDRGPNDPGQQYTRHLAMASGSQQQLASQNLGFRARCARVDNFSNQYVYFPDAESWVPAYLIGYTIVFNQATTVSRCDTGSTARGTVTEVTPITGELCVVTWCEKNILSTPVLLTSGTRAAP